MDKKLRQSLKSVYEAPPPTKKTVFLQQLPYPSATAFQFFLSQLRYIRKRFWCLSFLLLAVMAVFFVQFQQGKEVVGILSAALPLLTLLGITEISKSVSFNMGELEASCKYNLGRITLIRLSAIGTLHFLILLLSLLLFKGQTQYGILRYALYAAGPFLLSSYLSVWITNHLKTKDALYICNGVTIFISFSVYVTSLKDAFIYHDSYAFAWGIAFVIIAALLAKELSFLMHERIGQWNFV